MKNKLHSSDADNREGMVVAKAYRRAGESLGLTQNQLAEIIGVSRSQMSRLFNGNAPAVGKSGELAVYLIRVFRSLDAMTHGNDTLNREWMKSRNSDLGGARPIELVESPAGLVDVMNYLDAARAPI
ncbi:antitoxin Xre/MbcA/ParS toxin-binding domain-containing protein [uncultured Ruegeria sp.]|uniref:antitoxin Xre/MbcA/ParS toxin-binding domain-containing protein n=1 Tax=uncultured Ruegeria sp. TaxID=259304 RepID=UPI002623B7FF|nr:antitoxin Xre/MbcA/ParS toxin-binding domain-containing protein [uncultured Ruegeria sp.]